MQSADASRGPSPRLAREVDRALAAEYGPKRREGGSGDLIGELVATILSQNTAGANSRPAFAALKAAFPRWEDVERAAVGDLARAIHRAGLSNQRAARIKRLLADIRAERGELSLEFVRNMPDAEALVYLQGFAGVGPKTAACVLLLGMGRQVFPVDTHVFRVTGRLGWLPERCTPEQAHEALTALIPPELRYQLHVNLIAHGRSCCHARGPECGRCVVRRWCEHGGEATAAL